MKICIVGAGYVGLSLATMLSSQKEHSVNLLKIDKQKVYLLNNKISPISDEYIEN